MPVQAFQQNRPFPIALPLCLGSSDLNAQDVVQPHYVHIPHPQQTLHDLRECKFKVEPGAISGEYIDPTTGQSTFVPLPAPKDSFDQLLQSYNIALCNRLDRGEISKGEFKSLFDSMAATIEQEREKLALKMYELALEARKVEQERQKQELERQRLATDQQAIQTQQQATRAQMRGNQLQQEETQARIASIIAQMDATRAQREATHALRENTRAMHKPVPCNMMRLGGGMATVNCY